MTPLLYTTHHHPLVSVSSFSHRGELPLSAAIHYPADAERSVGGLAVEPPHRRTPLTTGVTCVAGGQEDLPQQYKLHGFSICFFKWEGFLQLFGQSDRESVLDGPMRCGLIGKDMRRHSLAS